MIVELEWERMKCSSVMNNKRSQGKGYIMYFLEVV